jgi:hypothetical protein
MANVVKIKHRYTGGAGAPSTLGRSELAFNEISSPTGGILYIGTAGESGGDADTKLAIGGPGAFTDLGSAQTVTNKTFGSGNTWEGNVLGAAYLPDATTSAQGVAQFHSDNFSVTSGIVTIKDLGISNDELAGSIANAKLANSSISVTDGSTAQSIALGQTLTFAAVANETTVAQSSGTVTIGLPDDVVITGNLTVNGTTTTVNTNDLVVKDSLIILAKDQSGSPTYDSGFVVERGSLDNVGLIWDETADEFSFITTPETGGTDGNVTISAQANVRASTFYGALSGNASTATNVAYTGLTGTVPTWNQDTTGTAANVTGTVAIANGGTGATSASAARTSLGITLANLGYTGVTNANNFTMNVSNDGGSSAAFASGDTLNITGGSGIGVNRTNSSYSIAVDTTSVCTLTATQVLDNKTIDGGTF